MYFEDLVFNLRPIEGINGCVFLQLRLIEYFNRCVIAKLHPIEHFNEGVIAELRLIEHLNGYVFTEWVVKMVSDGGEWVIGVRKMFYDTSGRVSRVREMFYDMSGWATRGREMFSDEGYGAAGATLGMYFPTFSLSSFLSLMKEKRAKENQAPTGGEEVGRVREGAGVVFSEVGRVQDGVEVVFSNWGGRAKKIPVKRFDGGNLRVVANDGMDYVGDSASGAFRSKMERRM